MTDVALPAVHVRHAPSQVLQDIDRSDAAIAEERQVPRAAGPAHSPAPTIMCTRSTGCQCVDCGISSAGAPRLPPVALGRTQHFAKSAAKVGRRQSRRGPAPMLAGAGGMRRRRRLAQQQQQQQQRTGDNISPDPWQPTPPREGPIDKMALLRGRRPRPMRPVARARAESAQKESGHSLPGDGQNAHPDADEQRETQTPHLNLARCSGCSRRFKPDRLARHEATCQGKKGKRVPFDSKSRSLPKEALQASNSARSNSAESSEESDVVKSRRILPTKKAKWKRQHEEFQAMLRSSGSMRESRSGGKIAVEQTAEPLDDRVACPHCNRKFNQEVADRHIPRCADIKAKPNGMLKKGGGICASAVGAGTSVDRQNPSRNYKRK